MALIAMMDADLNLELPILGQFGCAVAADESHPVAAIEFEEDGADAGLACDLA